MHIPQSSHPSLIIIVYPFFSIKSFGQTGIHFSQTPHSSKSITINLSPHKSFMNFVHFRLFNTILNYNILSLYNFVKF